MSDMSPEQLKDDVKLGDALQAIARAIQWGW
jgi:hypothetical protein